MRKIHNPETKARIVLEVLRGETTLNEIASKHNLHPTLLAKWKAHTVKNLPQIFENETVMARKQTKEAEKEKDELYQQIGKLSAQIEWLKKKSGN